MKFWPFYGERWTVKTAHLSPMREGLYLRLVIWTMTHEKPLPADVKSCIAIARLSNWNQAFAVQEVLNEFFTLQDDGWHQKTADEVLNWWATKGKSRSLRNADLSRLRVASLRNRAMTMREALRNAGVETNSRQGIIELRNLCAKHCVTLPETGDDVTRNGESNPVRNAVSINKNTKGLPAGALLGVTSLRNGQKPAPAVEGDEPLPKPENRDDDRPGPLTLALRALHDAGMADAYPAHPVFVELVYAGVEPRTFKATALEAITRGKGFGWAMATIKGRLADQSAPPRPVNGARSGESPFPEGLLTPEGEKRILAAMADPARDPWELPHIEGPPSPSKRDDT